MYYQISLLCIIASIAYAAKSSSSSSSSSYPSTLLPRQTSEFLIGGSQKPYPAGDPSPSNNSARDQGSEAISPTFPGDWPNTVYAYLWSIDNDALRKTQLGSDFARESPADVTSVQCWCAAGSLCSCEANDDIAYLDMLVSRRVDIATREEDDVLVVGLGGKNESAVTIVIRGTVSGDTISASEDNENDDDEDDEDDEENNNDDTDADTDTEDIDNENEDSSSLDSDDGVGNIEEIISANSAQALGWLPTWSRATVAVMVFWLL